MLEATINVPLKLTEKPESILLGYVIGNADLPHDRTLSIVGSGSTLRFNVTGIEGHVDLDLGPIAHAAAVLLTGERP